eukprot:CAMPEP_0117531916 /NCGR_PEP_ID=MMETSP0784-20121206/39102_1 /TAXON_ID=39447 /ORGANISM="" /LENGTH=327 /DNA_ID=CAMNT_0005328299 /DNA_START=64 /DNA_END=1047 /DNA_ORIENTATION=-
MPPAGMSSVSTFPNASVTESIDVVQCKGVTKMRTCSEYDVAAMSKSVQCLDEGSAGAAYSEDSVIDAESQDQPENDIFLMLASTLVELPLSKGRQPATNALFILDWDDTIFPTTWLDEMHGSRGWMNNGGGPHLPQVGREELRMLDCAACEFLKCARALGTVVCVTLSRDPWQQTSVQLCLPRLAEVWKELNIEVIYASQDRQHARRRTAGFAVRQTLAVSEEEAEFRNVMQKQNCIRRVIGTDSGKSRWSHVISIGDGRPEQAAMQEISLTNLDRFRTATVRTLSSPSCECVRLQMEILGYWLPNLCALDDSVDIDWNCYSQPPGA